MKFGSSLSCLSALLKKIVFYIQNCATSEQQKLRW